MTLKKARRLVAEAVDVLDDQARIGDVPRHWASTIDVETLALRSRTRCVLGQLYGDYNEAPTALRVVNCRQTLAFFPGSVWQSHQLRRAWLEALAERRRADDERLTQRRANVAERRQTHAAIAALINAQRDAQRDTRASRVPARLR
jgi:hypothetical protein